MLSLHTKGQSSVGVKTDVNLSNFWVNQSTHLKSSMNVGSSAGFFYNYKWHGNRAAQADMMFRYRTSKLKNQDTDETADYRYFGIELPVYFMLHGEIDNQTIYLGMGPFASFGLFSRYQSAYRNVDVYKEDTIGDKEMMRRCDYGVGFIIGFELKCRLQINFNYQMGFRNLVSDGFAKVNMVSQLNSFGVGYRF